MNTPTWADRLADACEAKFHIDTHHPANEYLYERGVTPLRGVGVGVLPEGIDYPDGFLDWANRAGWSTSVVFVLREFRGPVVGFQLRGAEAKTHLKFEVYDGATTPQFWNADVALPIVWQTKHLIVTEGAFDAAAVRYAGAQHVIATMGALPSQQAIRWMKRLTNRITCLYDMDEPGRKAAQRLSKLLEGVAVVSYPDYAAHDPWDLWVERPNALKALVGGL